MTTFFHASNFFFSYKKSSMKPFDIASNFFFSYKNSSMKPFDISKGKFKNKSWQNIPNLKNFKNF